MCPPIKLMFNKLGRLSSQEDIVGFASEFGFLGGDMKESIFVRRPTSAGESLSYSIGESIGAWITEINTIRAMTELWKHAATRGTEATEACLLKHCQQAIEDSHGYQRRFDLAILAQILSDRKARRREFGLLDVYGDLERHLKRDKDAISVARKWITQTVNVTLMEGVNARLIWAEGTSPRPRAQLVLAPPSLHQAIWLQLAQAVGGRKAYEPCHECGVLFEVGIKPVGRPNSYCSEACRQKAYRKRKAEARRLRKDGTAIEEIAKRLGVSEKSVETWTAPL